ncbi:tetratricopeptide repeat protein [Thalassotalea nanhaiensis]|uniref:Tetratricopeptide repeat protein n=1 Tax=Thalassotalea nanhaiensis TaxID=3065648 RepID=A0ABY9TH37_9GAMM|nr:tetratricopeptide repeat protein [Colwelliaceae bacterium SQ345]
MSVINEMLKDLDKRKADEQAIANGHYQSRMPATATNKNFGMVLIAILITASICIASMYFLFPNAQTISSTPLIVDNSVVEKTLNAENKQAKPAIVKTRKDDTVPANNNKNTTSEIATNTDVNVTPKEAAQKEPTAAVVLAKTDPEVVTVSAVQSTHLSKEVPTAIPTKEDVAKTSSLVISKVELTPAKLADKKLNIAMRALQNGQLKKAETLLEEAIILQPYYVEARKELAALWFGRKTYQPAKNLLSQGVMLMPDNEDFRMMLARIYSIEGNNEKAFKVLSELSTSRLLEYQLALASMASQSDHHVAAINAYNKLLVMRPEQSRWWLALAISYDSNEQYQPATSAYQKAIALGRLSSNSLQFAKQRLAELEG